MTLIDISLWKRARMYGYKGQVKWVTQKAFVSLHMPYLSAPPLPADSPSVCFRALMYSTDTCVQTLLAFGLPVMSIDLHLLPLCLLC